ELGVLDAAHGAARQDAVRDVGHHLDRAVLQQGFGSIHQRAAGIDNVVDEDAAHTLHFADDVHHLGFAWTVAAFVADGDRRLDAFGERPRAHHAADVRRHDHQVSALI